MDYRGIINEVRYHKWLTPILVSLIIGSNAWGIVSNMNEPDKELDYWGIAVWAKFECSPYHIPTNEEFIHRNPIKYWIHCASFTITGSIKSFPLLFNIGLLPLVYLLAVKFTNDRLIGLITLVAFLNNPLYKDWQFNGTYDNIWSFFLLLSIFLMHRKYSPSSTMTFILSVGAKVISLMYLPAWIYTHYSIRKNKYDLLLIFIGFISMGIVSLVFYNPLGSIIGFFPERAEDAVYRNISVLWQVAPLLAVFVVLSRNFIPKIKVQNEKIIWSWILCAILQNPLVYFFTLQDTYSYRYVPLAFFISVFIGMTLVNMGNWIQERQLAKASAL